MSDAASACPRHPAPEATTLGASDRGSGGTPPGPRRRTARGLRQRWMRLPRPSKPAPAPSPPSIRMQHYISPHDTRHNGNETERAARQGKNKSEFITGMSYPEERGFSRPKLRFIRLIASTPRPHSRQGSGLYIPWSGANPAWLGSHDYSVSNGKNIKISTTFIVNSSRIDLKIRFFVVS